MELPTLETLRLAPSEIEDELRRVLRDIGRLTLELHWLRKQQEHLEIEKLRRQNETLKRETP